VVRSAPPEPRSDPTARNGRSTWGLGLHGTLPVEIGKLKDLEHLCAALRSLGGPVGAARLRAAAMRSKYGQNKLSGTIVSWIGSMAKLTYL
jgi:hypothetical protein